MKYWRKPFDQAVKSAAPVHLEIDKERCKGCGYCIEYCPREVLKKSDEISSKGYTLVHAEDESKCIGCGFCEAICPEYAIKIHTTGKTEIPATTS